ncbi:MAG: hypothetical protein ACRCYV_03520 [Aeromonas sp.]
MLTAARFVQLIAQLPYKKALPDAVYLHQTTLCASRSKLVPYIATVAAQRGIAPAQWQVIKLFKREFKLSFLTYPHFFTDSYPALTQSITVNLTDLTQQVTHYHTRANPPILHRKETMLLPDHPAQTCGGKLMR